ncbi:MAG: HNH endonuclease [Firmicutes bacterium]|nr:HNH endonuclease [Bacillota bacterium]
MQTTHEHRRRARLKAQMVDKDITIEGLFRRDKGVCSLCGGRCDLEDYTVREGVFIAGDWYPSVDHIKPISKGGLHSWGNVQLAHKRCNTLKSDNEFE